MIKNRQGKQAKLLKELEETPFVTQACQRVGVSRATVYRWMEENSSFKYDMATAEEKGRDKLTDFTESKLMENIKNGQFASIKFWLNHNTKRYSPKPGPFYAKQYDEAQTQAEQDRKYILDRYIKSLPSDELRRLANRDYADESLDKLEQAVHKSLDQRNMPNVFIIDKRQDDKTDG